MKNNLRRVPRSRDSLVEMLSGLADACEADARRLDRASREVRSPELALLFGRYARRRSDLARELVEHIDQIEGKSQKIASANSQRDLRARGARSSRSSNPPPPESSRRRSDETSLLTECEQAERALRAMYEDALRGDLPGDLPMCIRRQALAIADAHDQIRGLCDALAWCAVPMAV